MDLFKRNRKQKVKNAIQRRDSSFFTRKIEYKKSIMGFRRDFSFSKNANLNFELLSSAIHGYVGMLKNALDRGANIDFQDSDGWSSLFYASKNGHLNAVKLLLSKGADVNIQDNDGWTALLLLSVCDVEYPEIADLLLRYGAEVDLYGQGGSVILNEALDNGNMRIAELLKQYGAQM